MDKLLTTDEVANFLQVHPKTVLRLCNSGKLQYSKVGKVLRFRREWVDQFVLEGQSHGLQTVQ